MRLLLHAVFVGFDHFLDHLTADGTRLLGGEVTVVALLEVDTNLCWCFLTSKLQKKLRRSRFIRYSSEISNKFIIDFDVLRSMLMNACILD